MADPPALRCRDLRVAYGDVVVLEGFELAVEAGETIALLGPSGSGKTTLLYAIAGFVPLERGTIAIGGATVQDGVRALPPERRDVALVFQNYALWPHLTAAETVAYPLRRRGVTRADARRRAAELLDLMGIAALADRRPDQLSGGQQQRVGLARALAREARLYLMDEPTAHLDAPLRAALQAEISDLRTRTGAAAVYATHDAGEALAVADRVALLRGGHLVQVGTPVEVYERPVDAWAAELTGPASVLEVEVVESGEGTLTVRIGDRVLAVPVPPDTARASGPRTRLLVRPDWVRLGADGTESGVRDVAFRGPHTDHRLVTAAGELVARRDGPPLAPPGDRVTWSLDRAWPLPEGDPPTTHLERP